MNVWRGFKEFLLEHWPGAGLLAGMQRPGTKTKVLFVCTANICRSPMALTVARSKAANRLLPFQGETRYAFDAAGVQTDRARPPMDRRARAALLRRGYAVEHRRARQITPGHFLRFDLVIAMDEVVLAELRRLCPEERAPGLRLLLDYAPGHEGRDLADPYYGDPEGFERVLDLCEQAIDGLLASLASARSPADAGHA